MAAKSKKAAARPKTKSAKPAEKAAESAKSSPAKAAGKAAKAPAAKAAKPAATKAPKKSAPAEAVGEAYYVTSGVLPIQIFASEPSDVQFVAFSTFDDAREHLLEQLVAMIEEHERVLHAVRRVASFSDYLDQRDAW